MEGPKARFGIDDVFRGHPRKEHGRKREVYEVQGVEGMDFFVKAIQSKEELEVLRLLSETGVSEKLLMHDEKKMIIEKIDGEFSQDYLARLVDASPDKYSAQLSDGNQKKSTFSIKPGFKTYVPERSVAEDEKIRTFVVDFSAKLLLLELVGIVHNDIKFNNIFADKSGKARFIDFGEVWLAGDTKETTMIVARAVNDLATSIELLSVLHPVYKQKSQEIRQDESIRQLLSDAYASYQRESMPLSKRQLVIKELSDSGKLRELISRIGMPEELIADIESHVLALASGKSL